MTELMLMVRKCYWLRKFNLIGIRLVEKRVTNQRKFGKWYNQNKLADDPDFASLNSEQRSVIERNRSAGMGGDNAVPDAPFKDTWYQLALKRLTKYAADNGYERIGLTTGKRQIERFADELRQNVDEIAFSSGYPSKDITTITASQNGQPTFTGTVKDGKFIDGQARGKTVEEVLGKSMAKQIAEKESGVLKGDDLTIGGEGMKNTMTRFILSFWISTERSMVLKLARLQSILAKFNPKTS